MQHKNVEGVAILARRGTLSLMQHLLQTLGINILRLLLRYDNDSTNRVI